MLLPTAVGQSDVKNQRKTPFDEPPTNVHIYQAYLPAKHQHDEKNDCHGDTVVTVHRVGDSNDRYRYLYIGSVGYYR